MDRPLNIGVLGAGGLGKAAATMLDMKREMRLVAMCDSQGFLFAPDGLSGTAIAGLAVNQSIATLVESSVVVDAGVAVADRMAGDAEVSQRRVEGGLTDDPIGAMVARSHMVDGWVVALPNLPNEFIPSVVTRFLDAGYTGCFSDALKRTRAVELLLGLDGRLQELGGVYLTGCGATPGLLTASAVLAAASFMEVESVDIWWGVGIANWEAYRATIREDIAHLPEYSVERAKAMSDEEVEQLLDERDGKLELHEMEHADDILLQRAGVVDRLDQVEVGGIMDTRSAKKPVSTTMTLTGMTFEGKRSSHQFILGDDTSMAANVIGPALGYMKRAEWLRSRGVHGVFGSTEFMPMIVR